MHKIAHACIMQILLGPTLQKKREFDTINIFLANSDIFKLE